MPKILKRGFARWLGGEVLLPLLDLKGKSERCSIINFTCDNALLSTSLNEKIMILS